MIEELTKLRIYLTNNEVRHLKATETLLINVENFLTEVLEVACIKFTLYPEYWQNEARYTVEIASFVVEDYRGLPIDWIVKENLRKKIAGEGLFHPLEDISYEELINGGEDNYLTHFEFYFDRDSFKDKNLYKVFIGKIFQERLDRYYLVEELEKELKEKSESSGRSKV